MSYCQNFENSQNIQDEKQDYKSCFARSVAVTSQYSHSRTADPNDVREEKCREDKEMDESVGAFSRYRPEYTTLLRIKKSPRRTCLEEGRRYSCGAMSAMRQNPLYAQRISEIPIENMVHQNKVETLQWQLKEIEKSREMYRAVMKQVVTFLEKAHHSLEQLGQNQKNLTVPRSKSEHHITLNSTGEKQSLSENSQLNFSWNVTKKEPYISDKVIPPDKLSKEAFRLLRMTQSLLETKEPKLSQGVPECSDSEFLAQLAKEFPSTPGYDNWPKRSTSFTHNSSKITYSLESEVRISTAFNRKLSLQLGEARSKSGSSKEESGEEGNKDLKSSNSHQTPDLINLEVQEKSKQKSSPSISSGEDESGFSSLTSFQDIGLPLVNSTTTEEVSTRNALLKSMLHNSPDVTTKRSNFERQGSDVSNKTLLGSGSNQKSDSYRSQASRGNVTSNKNIGYETSGQASGSLQEDICLNSNYREAYEGTLRPLNRNKDKATGNTRRPFSEAFDSFSNGDTKEANNLWRSSSSASQHKRSQSTPIHQSSPKPNGKVLWV